MWLEAGLVALAVATMLIYFPLNSGLPKRYWDSFLDQHIPFVPIFILPYFIFFPCIVVSLVLLFGTPWGARLDTALIVGVIIGSLLRYFCHTGVHQPIPIRKDIFSAMVRWLYAHDSRAHTFPSSHVLISTICTYYVVHAFPTYSAWTLLTGFLIGISTVFVKQHYLVDIIGGLLVAVVAILFATHFVV